MRGCAFSGHRYIAASHRMRIKELLVRAIRYCYAEGCREFYNGGALGFDITAAEVFLAIKDELPDARLVMILPCAGQDTKWGMEERERFKRVLYLADEVICMSPAYYDGCMQVRNRELVSRSDILIAYLGQRTGGTAYTVKLAESRGLRVFNLYPALDKEGN